MIVLGCSVTSRTSFETAFHLLEQVHILGVNPVVIAVGNKIDLADSFRVITTKEARSRFEAMNPPIQYIETSAKTGENVKYVFECAVREWRVHKKNMNANKPQAGKSKESKTKKSKTKSREPEQPKRLSNENNENVEEKCIIS